RSSVALRGLVITPGIVDADYEGEIKVLTSAQNGVIVIPEGERLAQMILIPIIPTSNPPLKGHRGTKGFGSTRSPEDFWVTDMQERPKLTLNIDGKQFCGILDTGADMSILSMEHWPKGWQLEQTGARLQDSLYVANIVSELEISPYIGHQSKVAAALQQLQALIWARKESVFVGHIRGHSNLPGPLAEGNRIADLHTHLVLTSFDEAVQLHQRYHLNAQTLQYYTKCSRNEALKITTTCSTCAPFIRMPSLGVNPRGVRPNEIWQMDVTHVASFGLLKCMQVSVDTYSGMIFASFHRGECVKDVSKHLIQAFAYLGVPSLIKTDNGPAYASQGFQKFCKRWSIQHKTGIPYNPQDAERPMWLPEHCVCPVDVPADTKDHEDDLDSTNIGTGAMDVDVSFDATFNCCRRRHVVYKSPLVQVKCCVFFILPILTRVRWYLRLWFIYAMEYYAAEKNNDIMKFAGKWMELENVILSKMTPPLYPPNVTLTINKIDNKLKK
ncbi:hypothetical protein STEG23_008626, partial [Scotinomys teguina]